MSIGTPSLPDSTRLLRQAHDLETIVRIVTCAAREMSAADGATFVLRDGDQCFYCDENAIGPLWKGRRFPATSCISGWVMMNGRHAVIENVFADPRIPIEVYQQTFVRSLAMVPVRHGKAIAAIGLYWATQHQASARELQLLDLLADKTSTAMAALKPGPASRMPEAAQA